MLTWMAGHRVEIEGRACCPRYQARIDGVVLKNKQRSTRSWGTREAALKAAEKAVHAMVVAERAAKESERQLVEADISIQKKGTK